MVDRRKSYLIENIISPKLSVNSSTSSSKSSHGCRSSNTTMPPKQASPSSGGAPASGAGGASGGGQQIDLSTLSAQQILQVKKQLDEEMEHLNNSFTQLKGAQTRFSECAKGIETGVKGVDEGAPMLVPLTTSLYVPGKLASREKVVIDVGTGFYVEKVLIWTLIFNPIRGPLES